MAGADIFLMYADGKGNVTLSTRAGKGEFEPEHVQRQDVELLAGSGVINGKMIANVKCGYCHQVLDSLTGTTNWISAWKNGSPLDSTSVNAEITQHDEHVTLNIDLSKAGISSDTNPFVGSSSGGSSSGGSGSGSGSGSGDSGSSGSDSGAVTTSGSSGPDLPLTHGIIMTLVFVGLYPIGSMMQPLIKIWYLHATWQMVAFLLMWAGMGIGYVVAKREQYVRRTLFNFVTLHPLILTLFAFSSLTTPTLAWVSSSSPSCAFSRSLVCFTTLSSRSIRSELPSATFTSFTADH